MNRIVYSVVALCMSLPTVTATAGPVLSLQITSAFGSGHLDQLSADGTTAVGRASSGGLHAAYWRAGQAVTIPSLPPGANVSAASGVSADGRYLAGQGQFSGVSRGFRYDTLTNTYELFDNVAGGPLSPGPNVDGMSGDGQWVTGTTRPGNATSASGSWSPATGWRVHGVLPGTTIASSTDANFDGSVVVGFCSGTSGFQAFRWSNAGGMLALPGGPSLAWDTTSDGSIVVGDSGGAAAFWVGNGSPQFIPNAAGAALATGDGGALIGGGTAYPYSGISANTAFLWDSAHGTRLVSQVLQEGGVDITGMMFGNVTGISGDGTVIAGNMTLNGVRRSFIATIPAPGTLVVCAVPFLTPRRRR